MSHRRQNDHLHVIKGDVRDMIFGGARRARASAWKFQQKFQHELDQERAVEASYKEDECQEEPPSKRTKKMDSQPHSSTNRCWGEWTLAADGQGRQYYYNCTMGQSTWIKPPEVVAIQAAAVLTAERTFQAAKEGQNREGAAKAHAELTKAKVELGKEHMHAVQDGTADAFLASQALRGGAQLDAILRGETEGWRAAQGSSLDTSAQVESIVPPQERPPWAAKVKTVQWWYYKDASGVPQGPHYPGQMRAWYTAG